MSTVTSLIYLLAAILFIIGLKFLSSPRRARQGNWIAAAGMILAIAWTAFASASIFTRTGLIVCIVGVLLGGIAGAVSARKVKMTAIPQMVALFNGVGGAAAALVALASWLALAAGHPGLQRTLPEVVTMIIGGISFAGSIIAFAKLQELITSKSLTYTGQYLFNGLLGFAILLLTGVVLAVPGSIILLIILLLLILALGVAFVLPVGGADMPIIISLLNACTGLAVASSGIVLNNFVLIAAGILVGASGTLLTKMMSDAMGRGFFNILFGKAARAQGYISTGDKGEGRPVRAGNVEDIGMLLAYAHSVIIVPGYGLAVAQGQQVLRELADLLQKRGVEIAYAIHPVAGRMPGHMNVLLAEANVPYEQLKEMDEINDQFKQADVALIVGANDVVNPAARHSPGSDIYGMPILNADQAHNVIFLKRSMRPGFSGTENELFFDAKTLMLFGDAKESLTKLVAAVKTA